MALKPGTRRIVISDESVNSKEFWTLTNGVDLSLYHQNPLMLWNHIRPKMEDAKKDDVLPIGVFQNLTIDAKGVLSGLPAFDDTDPFAMSIYEKYEAGIINMASAGLQPLEVLTDKKHMKGKAPCLSKSLLAEISLTDIGSNRNAVKLYDNGKELQLTSGNDLIKLFFSNDNKINMLLKLTDFTAQLKLSENATEDDVLEAIKKQGLEVIKLTGELSTTKDLFNTFKKTVHSEKVIALMDAAEKDKKITAPQRAQYIKLAETDFDAVKGIIDAIPAYQSIEEKLKDDEKSDTSLELSELIKLSADELFMSGRMDRLKTISLPHFKLKYQELTGRELPQA